jgi:hypothetical protein
MMRHFTDRTGYNGISAQVVWRFVASKPPGDHPVGAYFTTLALDHPKLAQKLGIPREKTQYFFEFLDEGDLKALPGGRGRFILFSPTDYEVGKDRQQASGSNPHS